MDKDIPKYTNIEAQERERLYFTVTTQLGAGHAPFELTQEEMDVLLEVAIEDYNSFLQSWFITQQFGNIWFSFLGTDDILFAYTTKTLDFEKSFTYAYSKQVGMGANSPWELKKDFVTIEENQQVYTIPAGREVNEVLWVTPPFVPNAGFDPFAFTNWSAGVTGWNFAGRPAQYVQPAYTLLLAANDYSLKKRIQGSELTYKITGGANGTKNLYLYPVPGNRNEISTPRLPKHVVGSQVWYFYYDTTPQNEDNCKQDNPDVILYPSQFPLKKMLWTQFNDMSKSRIRRLFTSEVKKTIGNIRATWSGELKMIDFQLQMDYRNLIDQAEKERDALFEEFRGELENITFRKLMEDRAAIAESTNKVMSYVPFPNQFYKM